ncbi:MAG: hypothetical protein MPN21_20850 [Thermoanaerobaculia bacterium]|nr:hypothetical protein [Thermoanaerobaculia bacterium]
MELTGGGFLAIGCAVALLLFVGVLALQALFLHLGAKLAGVQAPYRKAFRATVAIGLLNAILQLGLALRTDAQDVMKLTLADFFTETMISVVLTLIVGTVVVTWIYSISILRAFSTYLASMLLGTIASLLVIAGLVGIIWITAGRDKLDQLVGDARDRYYEAMHDEMLESGQDPSSLAPAPIDLLSSEFTELENAVDVPLAQAQHHVGKTVRIIHGPQSESIGTLKEVRSKSLVVSVKIDGGWVEIPIRKSKITTFQTIER